jgi:selenocysteine-specific elongation factor
MNDQRHRPPLPASDRVNALLELAPGARALKHRTRVRLELGGVEVLARALLWETAALQPGETGLVQLHLEQAVAARAGDPFIVRWYSPPDVLGDGAVLEPCASPFLARDADVAARLRALASGDADQIVRQALAAAGPLPLTIADLALRSGLAESDIRKALDGIVAEGAARLTAAGYVETAALESVRARWTARLTAYHARFPLLPGMPREELRARELSPPAFDALVAALEEDAALVDESETIRLPDFAIRLRPDQEANASKILDIYRDAGWQPPPDAEVTRALGPHRATRELWGYLAAEGFLVPLGDGLYLHAVTACAGMDALRALFETRSEVTVGMFRDAVGASRRAAVPFLEWCDAHRITLRDDDTRLPGPNLRVT